MALGTAATLALAGSTLLPIAGSLYGQEQAKGDKDAARRAREAALAQFAGIEIPDVEKQKLALEGYDVDALAAKYAPELETALALGPTSLEQVSVDPRLRQNQMAALEQVGQIASTGLSDADRANLELIRRQAAGEAQAKQDQILQNMQARGQGGSGAELIAKLQAGQSAADRMNQQALEQAKIMQQARMQALSNQSSMAGNIRSQEYGEQSDLARARDVINQFNVQNQQNVGSRNVASKNREAEALRQLTMANIDTRNKQQVANKNLMQQQYQNQMDLAAARAGQQRQAAAGYQQDAASTAGMWAGIGQGLGGAAGAIGGALGKQGKSSVDLEDTQSTGQRVGGGKQFAT